MNDQHLLERRSMLLAEKLRGRVDLLRNALAGPGDRPPFTTQLSKPEALAFWRQHYSDNIGKPIYDAMEPADQMELNVALSKANEAQMRGGQNVP